MVTDITYREASSYTKAENRQAESRKPIGCTHKWLRDAVLECLQLCLVCVCVCVCVCAPARARVWACVAVYVYVRVV